MNYYGMSKDEAVTKTIQDYRHAAAFAAPMQKTLEQFDGKVYNKRFLDALRANAGYDRIHEDRRAQLVYIYVYGKGTYNQHTICCIQLSENKRINAAESKKSVMNYYTKHLQEAAEIEEIAPQVDIIKSRIAELKGLIRQLECSIPCELRDIYGIHHTV